MNNIDNLNLSIDTNPFLLSFGIVLFFLYCWFIYRFTVPSISQKQKIFLITIRTTIILLLFASLFEPILTIQYKKVIKPYIDVFIDNSASLSVKDSAKRVSAINKFQEELKGINLPNVHTYTFGVKPFMHSNIEKKISFTERVTNFANVIDTIKSKKDEVSAAIILSDGIITDGSVPIYDAERLSVPIFTIGLGDTTTEKDVSIYEVIYNQFIYKGKKTQIDVQIKNSELSNRTARVLLYEEDQLITSKEIILSASQFNQLTFDYLPEISGDRKLKVSVLPVGNEKNLVNNSKTFFLNVIETKLKVAVFAGSPSPDLSAILQALKKDPNLEVKSFIHISPQKSWQDYKNIMIDSTDIFFLIDFPVHFTPNGIVDRILTFIEKGKPFFIQVTPNSDLALVKRFEKFLPITITQISSELVTSQVELVPNRTIFSRKLSQDNNWDKLPPIMTTATLFNTKFESHILMYSNRKNSPNSLPLLVARNVANRRSIAFLAGDIWRWQLSTSEKDPLFFSNFLNEIVKWLSISNRSKQFFVSTNKKLYEVGEQVEFTAELYDQSYQPVDSANISITIKKENLVAEIALEKIKDGIFKGTWEAVEEGDFSFQSVAKFNGTQKSDYVQRFSVTNSSIEKSNTVMNTDLLRKMAKVTGGIYFPIDNYFTLFDEIKKNNLNQPKEYFSNETIKLWSSEWIMFLIILLFAVEWFTRKRLGML